MLKISDLKVNDELVVFVAPRHKTNGRYYVKGFINDRVVVCSWQKTLSQWHYEVVSQEQLDILGEFIKVKKYG